MITDPTNKMVREIIRIYQDRVLGIAFLVLVPAAILLGLPTGQYSPSANWWHSVSQTYYAADSAIMIGILSVCGILFITHRSKEIFERIVFVIAGISILGVVACPYGDEMFEYVGLFHLPNAVSGKFHILFAIIMFVSFGFLSIINFPLRGTDFEALKAANTDPTISYDPTYIKRGTRVDKLVKLICRNEEELESSLTEKQKEIIRNFAENM